MKIFSSLPLALLAASSIAAITPLKESTTVAREQHSTTTIELTPEVLRDLLDSTAGDARIETRDLSKRR